jgi:hypothetical protein
LYAKSQIEFYIVNAPGQVIDAFKEVCNKARSIRLCVLLCGHEKQDADDADAHRKQSGRDSLEPSCNVGMVKG